MGCCECCTKANEACRKVTEPFYAILRVLENIPILGHLIAAIYACSQCKDRAERAGIKASVGLAMVVCNCPAEAVDEVVRHRSPRLVSWRMTPRQDWMRHYQRRTLRHLCMPASHQSATYVMARKLKQIPMVEGWSRCQDLSIDSQLYGGVRLLDLRVMLLDGDIWLHHQEVVCVTLRDVLKVVRDFITENRTEIVFLYITNDGKNVDWMKVHSLINEYIGKKLVPEYMRERPIGDIIQNGKNVIVSGIPNVAYCWRGIDYRWPNKTSPEAVCADFQDTMQELRASNPYFLFWYKMEVTVDANTVIRSIGGLPSVCVSGCTSEKFDFLEDVAAATNHRLLQVLSNHETRVPANFISTDFVNDDIIERILTLNSMQLAGAGSMTVPLVVQGSRGNLLTDVKVERMAATGDHNSTLSRTGVSMGGGSDVGDCGGGGCDMANVSLLSAEQRTEVWESTM